MCSHFGQGMDNYQGDLTDILRASGGAAADAQDHMGGGWQFSSNSYDQPMIFPSIQENFGDPFSHMQDPLLSELDIAGPSFFNSSSTSSEIVSTSVDLDPDPSLSGGNMVADQSTIIQDEMKNYPSCNNMFSQMMISQNPTLSDSSSVISTAASSPRGISNPVVVSRDMVNANSSNGCLVDNTGLQISSPRNPGIKRRKSEAKKVVCIPAPASANGRPGGEVVPSDLWAWRKYGQKPIKGSPYPRGYYRCSSSKGCSARKQVERSRTDPNMLVITYTSEHNHPWPTQRNSLAGSTRSQASKSITTSKTSTSFQTPKRAATTMKAEDEDKDSKKNIDTAVVSPCVAGSSSAKEETTDQDIENKQMDMDDGDNFCHSSYIPTMPDSSKNSEDFFVDLGELEGDHLSGLFSQGFTGDKHKVNKGNVDPFSALFD